MVKRMAICIEEWSRQHYP